MSQGNAHRLRLGLRAQIVLALSFVYALSFALLGTAALRLTRVASDAASARSARLYAEVLGAALSQEGLSDVRALDAALDALAQRRELAALRVIDATGRMHARGHAPASPGVEAKLPGGGKLTLWLDRAPARARVPLGDLLLFYVAITGLAVLVLAYSALTYLIVRPLDRLTRGSEQLAAGMEVQVPERGAAEVVRLAAAFNDMARQLRAEQAALEQRLHELEQATVELKATQRQLIHGEKLASVGRLAAGVAHEIGNPLAAILGLVQLLRAGEVPADASSEFLMRIERETERIHRIIRDLLDFARRDPEADVAGQSADLAEVIRDAVNLVKPQKESKEIAIEVEVEPGLGRVLGPQPRLTQVVLNLLLNAVDALEGRGRVRLEAGRAGDLCSLVVSDDGPGLLPEVLDHVFEPFTTTKPPGKGTGLGLAVCHTLVEGMGGTITASNRPEGGARFEMRLRFARA